MRAAPPTSTVVINQPRAISCLHSSRCRACTCISIELLHRCATQGQRKDPSQLLRIHGCIEAKQAWCDDPAGKTTGSKSPLSSRGIFTDHWRRQLSIRIHVAMAVQPPANTGGCVGWLMGLHCQQHLARNDAADGSNKRQHQKLHGR